MSRSALAIVIAVFLCLAALYNLGAGLAQFGKAKVVSGTTSALASMGESAAALNQRNSFNPGGSSQLQAQSQQIRDQGARSSAWMYIVAIGILLTAVLQLVGGIGVFARSDWTAKVLLLGGVAGVLVELQDIAEDGFGAGQLVFLAIAGAAIYLGLQLKAAAPQPAADAAVGG